MRCSNSMKTELNADAPKWKMAKTFNMAALDGTVIVAGRNFACGFCGVYTCAAVIVCLCIKWL